ncbi:hypothetical protein ACQUWY_14370, partial [Ralstonia pseudosolanacearum]
MLTLQGSEHPSAARCLPAPGQPLGRNTNHNQRQYEHAMRPIISTPAGTSSLAIPDTPGADEAQRADPFQPASRPRSRHPQFERLPSPPVRTRSQELRAARL